MWKTKKGENALRSSVFLTYLLIWCIIIEYRTLKGIEMRQMLVVATICGCCLAGSPALAQKKPTPKPPPVSLRGSGASVAWMEYQAELHDFSRMSTGAKILEFFGKDRLVK